jgi:hypothetical protein
MLRPTSINFTGVTMSNRDLESISNAGVSKIVLPDWARVAFSIPTNRNAIESVLTWLTQNCTGQFTIHKFHNLKTYTEYKCVIRFELPNDALIFKLSDGHRAWEHTDKN